MSIAKGIAKAAKAQARGLQGKRNSQGDFMPEEVQMKGVQDAVDIDVQQYVDKAKSQIDSLDDAINEAAATGEHNRANDLSAERDAVLEDLIKKLEEEGVEVPEEIWQMTAKYSPDENQVMY